MVDDARSAYQTAQRKDRNSAGINGQKAAQVTNSTALIELREPDYTNYRLFGRLPATRPSVSACQVFSGAIDNARIRWLSAAQIGKNLFISNETADIPNHFWRATTLDLLVRQWRVSC